MTEKSYGMAEIQEAERQRYRAQCRVRCLEANLDRIAPEEFEPLMASLEAARVELEAAGLRVVQARTRYAAQKSE